MSCSHNIDYKATESCNNLKFHAAKIFPNEEVLIKYNNGLILSKLVEREKDGYNVMQDFCLPKTKNCTIQIISIYKSVKYLDTTFIIKDLITTGYHIVISMPQPLNWRKYYEKEFHPRKWGYLPIDSCIRFVSLNPDSVYNGEIRN